MRMVFVDDDPDEIEAFSRLMAGTDFQLVPICAQTPTQAYDAIVDAVGKNEICLFILDLYFPESTDSPTGFDSLTAIHADEVRRPVANLSESVQSLLAALNDHPEAGKVLLREANDVTQAARRLLDTWCQHLDQSPAGGLRLLRSLRESKRFRDTPAVFYSRKATLRDAKDALAEGAIDVIPKLDSRAPKTEERKLLKIFEAYCNRDTPSFLKKWLQRVRPGVTIGPGGVTPSIGMK